jgi:hypothetical protein
MVLGRGGGGGAAGSQMTFQVVNAARMKMAGCLLGYCAVWSGRSNRHVRVVTMLAAKTFGTSVRLYQITRRNSSEDSQSMKLTTAYCDV